MKNFKLIERKTLSKQYQHNGLKSFTKIYSFIYFTIQIPPDYYTADYYIKYHS